jgi:hypothetical protein
MEDSASFLVALFERLDKDFWARSVDPRHLFTKDVTDLHGLLPKFVGFIGKYAGLLSAPADGAFHVRMQQLLLKHQHHQEANDVTPIAVSIIRLVSENTLFDAPTTASIKVQAALMLVINLAIRKRPLAAREIMRRLPTIPAEFPLDRILFNRARAEIGTAAFQLGLYGLAYESLRQFPRGEVTQKSFGQSPNIYPPWLAIESKAIVAFWNLSAIILDMPNLTVVQRDDSNLPIKAGTHKQLEREPQVAHPETLPQRLADFREHCKNGEWAEAFESVKIEVVKHLKDFDRLITDIKKVSLCSFLLTADRYYDSISIAFLADKFKLVDDVVLTVVGDMLNKGVGPIEAVRLSLQATMDPTGKFVLFGRRDLESLLVGYGLSVQNKAQAIDEQVKVLSTG